MRLQRAGRIISWENTAPRHFTQSKHALIPRPTVTSLAQRFRHILLKYIVIPRNTEATTTLRLNLHCNPPRFSILCHAMAVTEFTWRPHCYANPYRKSNAFDPLPALSRLRGYNLKRESPPGVSIRPSTLQVEALTTFGAVCVNMESVGVIVRSGRPSRCSQEMGRRCRTVQTVQGKR